ncbi:MAG: hypothetical protein RL722_2112, partial [Pseudomonadota bacterium]
MTRAPGQATLANMATMTRKPGPAAKTLTLAPENAPAPQGVSALIGPAADEVSAVRGKLAGQVYERLKGEMNDFRLVPGDRFSEAEVAARLGVSRTPVREALFRLRNEGVL